jgi:DNA-binding transcriptional MerR regulator
MKETLFSTGEFAKLARTTKRTILFYNEKGILKPAKIGVKNYRYYEPNQILDFQIISLLRNLGVSLNEIKKYLDKKYSLQKIFELKRNELSSELEKLQNSLNKINYYNDNLEKTGFMIEENIKEVESFEIYYIVRRGPYAKIKDYCLELKAMFEQIPDDSVFVNIFVEGGYKPKDDLMKIGIIKNLTLHTRPKSEEIQDHEPYLERIQKYKALYYIYKGPGSLLSIHWDYINDIAEKKGYKRDSKIPHGLELYLRTSLNGVEEEENMVFEIQLPILLE